MLIINQDLLAIKEGVIVHQVNNRHVMGAGVAKAIKERYPQHFIDYRNNPLVMGTCVSTRIRALTIVGIVAQDGYGRDRRYTDYDAFKQCLQRLAKAHKRRPDIKVYMPYKIGCGNAGGDWEVISKLIDLYAPFIIICKQ